MENWVVTDKPKSRRLISINLPKKAFDLHNIIAALLYVHLPGVC